MVRSEFSKWSVVGFALVILALWLFPLAWYTSTDRQAQMVWLTEKIQLDGWQYEELPVTKSAEAVLVADRLVSGQFSRDTRDRIQVFSAKRYTEKENHIGLFVHTPDRCWTESGWKLEPATPTLVTVQVHGISLQLERRIFVRPGQRELVYFGGMVGGQPVPYRLDHNMSVGMKYASSQGDSKTGAKLRASDSLFWRRVWESFASRRPLLGPKQFVRVSASLLDRDISEADRLLQEFLPQWLTAVDYQSELNQWQKSQADAGKD